MMPEHGPSGSPPQDASAHIDSDAIGALPPGTVEKIVHGEYLYAAIGMVVGALVLCAGAVMIFVGVTGAVDLTFGTGIHVKTAVVGVAIAVIGAVIIIATRPNLVFGKKKRSKR